MRKMILGLLLLSISKGFAQSYACDIAQGGLGISPGTIATGQTADFKFTVSNQGSGQGCIIPANSVEVVLSLPTTSGQPRYYQFQSFVSPANGVGTYFTFTYDRINNVVIGTNQNPIPNDQGDANVTIRVLGIEPTPANGASSILNLAQTDGTSNNPANDASQPTPLIVTGTILPITLEKFQATSKGCQNVLNWNTLQEENTKSFVVESGKDGLNFTPLATLAASGNSASAKTYSYTDVAPTDVTHYRLKTMDADGKFAYSNTVKVKLNCSTKSTSLYPNPILGRQQQLTVSIVGYKGKITGELLSATGQSVKSYTLLNGINTIAVENLALGTYIFKIKDGQDGEAISHKVLVIK